MTTIIADKTGVAGDSIATSPYGLSGCSKVFRLQNSAIVGIAGTLIDWLLFIDWLRGDMEGRPPPMREVEALMLHKKILYHFDSSPTPMKVTDTVAVIGSGAQFALGAYTAGASLKEALRIARKFDPYTAGQIKFIPVRTA